MDKHEKAVRDGEAAARLLADPMLTAAFGDTERAILQAIAALPNLRGEEAHDLHRMLKCMGKVRRCIEVHISTGKVAAREIEGRSRLGFLRRA